MQPSFNDFQQNIAFDNSDTFWLIFADYCDENDISHDIREQVNTPKLESWCHEYTCNIGSGVVGCGFFSVGSVGAASVGSYAGFTGGDDVGSLGNVGNWVGSKLVRIGVGGN